MEIHWHPQIRELIKRSAPDLIIGLLGIPVALAFQEVSMGITSPPQTVLIENIDSVELCSKSLVDILTRSENIATGAAILGQLILSFLYLASLYLIVSYALLDILHHPGNWGSRLERWVRFLILCPSVISLALLGVYGKHLNLTRDFVMFSFLCVSLALVPDFRRGRQVLQRKAFTSYGWVFFTVLSLVWDSYLIPA